MSCLDSISVGKAVIGFVSLSFCLRSTEDRPQDADGPAHRVEHGSIIAFERVEDLQEDRPVFKACIALERSRHMGVHGAALRKVPVPVIAEVGLLDMGG